MAYALSTHRGSLVRAVYGVNDGNLTAWLYTPDLVQIGVEVDIPILKTCYTDVDEYLNQHFSNNAYNILSPHCDKGRGGSVDDIYKLSIILT